MQKAIRDLTKGNLWKQIILFSLPLMASNLLQVVFHMADTSVVGHFAGAAALGSVGSTTTLITFFTWFIVGMSFGVNALVAQNIGARDNKSLEKSVHSAAIICFAMGILLFLIGFIFARDILELLGTKEDLIDDAVLYFKIYMLGMPGAAIYNFGNAVLSAAGDTKRPLVYLTISGAVNIVLNLFLVIVCDMGVAGVGIATTVSLYISAILILIALLRSNEAFKLCFSKLGLDAYASKKIIGLGITTGLQYSLFSVANLFIQSGVNTFETVVVEGNSAAINMDNFVYDALNAIYAAATSFVGQNYGARNKKRILHSYLICLIYSFGLAAIMGSALCVFGRQFLSLFTSEAAVIEAGLIRVQIMGLTICTSSLMDCAVSASRGLGKTVMPTIFVGLGVCVFRILWIYTIFAHFHTMAALYLLYVFSWVITGTCEISYFFYTYKKITKDMVPLQHGAIAQ